MFYFMNKCALAWPGFDSPLTHSQLIHNHYEARLFLCGHIGHYRTTRSSIIHCSHICMARIPEFVLLGICPFREHINIRRIHQRAKATDIVKWETSGTRERSSGVKPCNAVPAKETIAVRGSFSLCSWGTARIIIDIFTPSPL